MIKACIKVESGSHNIDILANTKKVNTLKVTPQCYRCGQQGHMKMNCPHKSASSGKFQGQRNANMNCS